MHQMKSKIKQWQPWVSQNTMPLKKDSKSHRLNIVPYSSGNRNVVPSTFQMKVSRLSLCSFSSIIGFLLKNRTHNKNS